MTDILGTASGSKKRVKGKQRVKTPTVIQMEAVECGAACLDMILAFYGRWVPLDKMRMDCGVSRDGSKASYIVKAAREYGLTAEGLRRETEALKELTFPMVAFWNFNHFVVIEGYAPGKWYLNDPAVGPREVDSAVFDRSYTGVVLTFEPGPKFERGGQKPSVVRSLRRRAKGMGTALTYAIIAGLCLTVIGLVIPTFIKIYLDHYLIGREEDWVKPLLWAILLTIIIKVFVTWLQQSVLLRLEVKLALATSSKFFNHVLRLPMDFFAQRFGGEIQSRISLNNRVAQTLSGHLATTLLHCLTAGFFLVIMLQYDVLMTVISFLIAVLNLGALKYVSRKREDLTLRLLQEQGKLLGVSMSGLKIIETLKSTGGESDFFSRWAGYQTKALNSEQDLGYYSQILDAVPTLLSAINNMAILGLGGMEVMKGHLTMGDLVAYQALMAGFSAPINNLVSLGGELQQLKGDLYRLDDVLDNETDPELKKTESLQPEPDAPAKLSGRVELNSISFGYGRFEKPLITDFSLTLNPGSRVAIVGSSGSGKSTIAKLIAGLYLPWSGEILFDGKPRDEIPRKIMNNSLSSVDQEILLFEGTVRENITLWNDTIPEADVVGAAKDAAIHDVIAARAEGYESKVLENGRNFSGGQGQRLEIARVLAGNPTIVILDEATSALDPLTERIIDDNLRRRGCTVIIVAHRLSTIRDCDEIIVLRRGNVVQRGTHDELIATEGLYVDLVHQT
jgi:NHLM bacteriocin system ABC transporter peptidase/ATP-binding protein